jgi:hypothetical protein
MAAAASPARTTVTGLLGWVFLVTSTTLLTLVGAAVALAGTPYWLVSPELRPDHPLHQTYAPGALLGILLGIVGTGLMLVVLLYSVHKWIPFLSGLGSSQFWMRFHLLAGLLGPFYIVLHGGLKMPSGFIGIGFWCMILVAISGFFGRYLFGYFPAAAQGLREDLQREVKRLDETRAQLVAATRDGDVDSIGRAVKLARDLTFEPTGLAQLVVLDADVRRRGDLIRVLLHRANLPAAVRRRAERSLLDQLTARRNLAGFEVARRLLRYWSLFHQPLAFAMYAISAVHILNALLFGRVLLVLFGGLFE